MHDASTASSSWTPNRRSIDVPRTVMRYLLLPSCSTNRSTDAAAVSRTPTRELAFLRQRNADSEMMADIAEMLRIATDWDRDYGRVLKRAYEKSLEVWRPRRDSNPCFSLERATS